MRLALEAGRLVADRYRLERMLGKGGMGEVWAATHTVTCRSVALKFLREPPSKTPELRRRFLREARAASAIQHPNVVEVLDVFELDSETPLMVMELLSGETLRHKLQREQQLSLTETASILLPAVSAVGTAHALGIIHRDITPDNLFLTSLANGAPAVKILDFGIAKLTTLDAQLTKPGARLGTPCYMAPEQAVGDGRIDHRVDVWAMGVLLYECLSGIRPIEGDSVVDVLRNLMNTAIMPLDRIVPGLPADIVALVGRMLARERGRRPQDLREVAEVLARYSEVPSPAFGAAGSETDRARARLQSGVRERAPRALESRDAELRRVHLGVVPIGIGISDVRAIGPKRPRAAQRTIKPRQRGALWVGWVAVGALSLGALGVGVLAAHLGWQRATTVRTFATAQTSFAARPPERSVAPHARAVAEVAPESPTPAPAPASNRSSPTASPVAAPVERPLSKQPRKAISGQQRALEPEQPVPTSTPILAQGSDVEPKLQAGTDFGY